MRFRLLSTFGCLLLTGLLLATAPVLGDGTEPSATPPTADGMTTLLRYMTGSFSSLEQSRRDPEYREIELHMVPIWTERSDGPWLYVEQAAATARDRPYRQRIYRLESAAEGRYVSRVYTLPGDPLRFAGAWREGRPLSAIGPDQLTERTGCAITLRPTADGTFVGSTDGRSCPSELRGASYATSEVVLGDGRLDSWDRGFDDAGAQVWGATDGAYEFRRLDP